MNTYVLLQKNQNYEKGVQALPSLKLNRIRDLTSSIRKEEGENKMHNYYNGKRLPEYYDTMYLDGFSADEVYVAFHRSMQKKVSEMQEKQRREIELEKELEQQVEEKLEKTLNKALDELLKGFK